MATITLPTVILPRSPKGEFKNEPFVDFSKHENAHAMKEALTRVGDMLGHEYELIIGGERLRTAGKIESHNPARPAQVVGIHQKAGAEHAGAGRSGRSARICHLAVCSRRRTRLPAAKRSGDHSRP